MPRSFKTPEAKQGSSVSKNNFLIELATMYKSQDDLHRFRAFRKSIPLLHHGGLLALPGCLGVVLLGRPGPVRRRGVLEEVRRREDAGRHASLLPRRHGLRGDGKQEDVQHRHFEVLEAERRLIAAGVFYASCFFHLQVRPVHERHAVHGPEQVSLEKCVEKMRPFKTRQFLCFKRFMCSMGGMCVPRMMVDPPPPPMPPVGNGEEGSRCRSPMDCNGLYERNILT